MSFEPNVPNDPQQFPPAPQQVPPTPYTQAPPAAYTQVPPPAYPTSAYPPQGYDQSPAAALAGPVKVLAICYLILAALGVLVGLGIMVVFPTLMGISNSQNPGGPAIPAGIGIVVGIFVLLLSGALPLATGYGLLKAKPWGRVMSIVNACLIVLSIPVGTALGGFTLYYMLRGGAKESYDQLSRQIV